MAVTGSGNLNTVLYIVPADNGLLGLLNNSGLSGNYNEGLGSVARNYIVARHVGSSGSIYAVVSLGITVGDFVGQGLNTSILVNNLTGHLGIVVHLGHLDGQVTLTSNGDGYNLSLGIISNSDHGIGSLVLGNNGINHDGALVGHLAHEAVGSQSGSGPNVVVTLIDVISDGHLAGVLNTVAVQGVLYVLLGATISPNGQLAILVAIGYAGLAGLLFLLLGQIVGLGVLGGGEALRSVLGINHDSLSSVVDLLYIVGSLGGYLYAVNLDAALGVVLDGDHHTAAVLGEIDNGSISGLLGNGVGILHHTTVVGEVLGVVTLLLYRATTGVVTRSNRGQGLDNTTMVVLIEHGVHQKHLCILAAFPLGNTIGYPCIGVLAIGILPVTYLTLNCQHVQVGLLGTVQRGAYHLVTAAGILSGHVKVGTFLSEGEGDTCGQVGDLEVPTRHAGCERSPYGNLQLSAIGNVICSYNNILGVDVQIRLSERR